jgi:Protein of unknown function (DUF3634)
MELLVGLAIFLLLGIPFALALRRSNELFCVEIAGKHVRIVRGRLPQRLLDDLADVFSRPPKERARIRVVVEQGRARVVVAGGQLSDARLQQTRNVVGTYHVAQIRAGGRARRS